MPGLRNVITREVKRLASRPIFLAGSIIVPLAMVMFFVTFLSEGLPTKVPVAIVDLDHSQMSRKITRSLNAMELIDITRQEFNFAEANEAVQRGDIYGFFVVPEDFERNAVAGESPTLTFYSNLTYFVPGTLLFKGFKTMAVTTAGNMVQTTLVAKGASQETVETLLQPMTVQNHPLNNPWINYSYYISPSFTAGLVELMIFLITVYSIALEIKNGTSRQWLETAGGNIWTALIGKLAPQTLIFTLVMFATNAILFGFLHFPMNGSMAALMLASFLFVAASQSFAAVICSIIPHMRLALSTCSLAGIIAFSIAAFSFPAQSMYGSLAIFSNILPVRWYFLIYIDQALNGIPMYYSRFYYASLLVFPILAMIAAPLLGRAARKPVYLP